MATTTYGSPYVQSSDLVSGWPTASQNVANRIDDVALKGNGINAQSGAGYTLVLTDAGKLVTVSNASSQNLTIPLNSSVAYATGTTIEVLNIGAGTWTLTPTGGVTLTGSTSIPTSARVRLTKTGTDTWYANTLGGGGLTFITSGTVSAGSTLSISNCFSATFENYRIVFKTDVATTLRWRVSGADNSTANYYEQFINGSNTVVSGSRSPAQTSNNITTGAGVVIIDVFAPFTAAPHYSLCTPVYGGTSLQATFFTYYFGASTSFDGFSIHGTTMTATARVYGYQNS